MTIFDYIRDIVTSKTGNLCLDEYVPFLVNRWLSFINPEVCLAINSFNSKTLLENKELHYKTMLASFPKMKYCPRINYIKKIKEDKTQVECNKNKIIAQHLELSEREIEFLFSGLC